jgi:hypothetical protein
MKTAFYNTDNIVTALKSGDWSASKNPNKTLVADGEACAIGMKFDPNASPRFANPTFVPPTPRPAKWTAFQFLLRFTEQEREVFRVAALTDGKVADFMQLCGAASEVEANHPLTVAGMAYLVSQDLLTQARADEVLAK